MLRISAASWATLCLLVPASASLITGPSTRTLGSNRENLSTTAYEVGSFGWFGITMGEQHPEYRYPTPDDVNPAGYFMPSPDNAARGDFNGDGREDLLVSWSIFPHTVERTNRYSFTVLLNDGAGGFRAAPELFGGTGAPALKYLVTRLAVADFNLDGRPDFVGAPEGLNQRNADGTFTTDREPVPLVLSGPDGKLYDATANIVGQANGQRVPGMEFSHDLSAGDINGDGAPDLYTAKFLFLNDGTGRLTSVTDQLPEEMKISSTYVMSSAIGDLNADGIGDIVCAYADGATANASGYVWLSRDGSASLANRELIALPPGRYGAGTTKFNDLRLVDLDDDGRLDLVFGVTRATPYYQGRTLQILMNRGNSFVDETVQRVVEPDYLDAAWGQGLVQVADVNRDGRMDIVHTGGLASSEDEGPALTVYLNGEDRVLRPMENLPWVQPWQMQGFEPMREFQQRSGSMTYVVDIDRRGALDFVSLVTTPLAEWPQVEPNEHTFYSVLANVPPVDPAARTPALTNLSVRTPAGSGARTVIIGFSVADGSKQILLRGVGPTLAAYGLTDVLANPRLALYNGPTVVGSNHDWAFGSATAVDFGRVGAFQLNGSSRDAALLADISGGRTVHLSGAGSGTGVGLVELYDAGNGSGRLVNVSARAEVGTGADILIAGFVVNGPTPRRLLVRAIGPTLKKFELTGLLADPVLHVFDANEQRLDENDDWGGGDALVEAFNRTGAFPLDATSQDAALVVTLPPGRYSAHVVGAGNTTGVALVEVYEVP